MELRYVPRIPRNPVADNRTRELYTRPNTAINQQRSFHPICKSVEPSDAWIFVPRPRAFRSRNCSLGDRKCALATGNALFALLPLPSSKTFWTTMKKTLFLFLLLDHCLIFHFSWQWNVSKFYRKVQYFLYSISEEKRIRCNGIKSFLNNYKNSHLLN